MTDRRTLDPNTYLQAVALFAMACHHTDKAAEFAEALAKTLGYESENDMGHIQDAFYGSSWPRASFDELLKREGFDVMNVGQMLKEAMGSASLDTKEGGGDAD
jgi:hypothetical protein